MLSGLRDNVFDGNAIRELREHFSRFYETPSIYKPTKVTEDQVKLRLFSFSLIGRVKYWLFFLPNGTIHTWKELEDKFLERFFTSTQFAEQRAEITNFKQHETKLLYDSWVFKLLLCRCPNHNMNNMEQMQNFIKGLKGQTCTLLDASVGGMIRTMTEPQVKDLIEKMCLNEYCLRTERLVKTKIMGTPKGMLDIDTHIILLAQIELLNKTLAKSSLNKANVSQVQEMKCDFYGQGHANGMCSLEGSSEES